MFPNSIKLATILLKTTLTLDFTETILKMILSTEEPAASPETQK